MTGALRHAALAALLALASVALAACNDTGDEQDHVVSSTKPAELPAWLNQTDNIEPAVWLRGREVGHAVLPSDPEVDRIRRGLHQSESRFFEDPRMVANRTAQTGEILAMSRIPERYVDILTGMIDVADVTPQKKLYGDMCQHYINLRKGGVDRTATLQQLMAAYRGGDDKKQD